MNKEAVSFETTTPGVSGGRWRCIGGGQGISSTYSCAIGPREQEDERTGTHRCDVGERRWGAVLSCGRCRERIPRVIGVGGLLGGDVSVAN